VLGSLRRFGHQPLDQVRKGPRQVGTKRDGLGRLMLYHGPQFRHTLSPVKAADRGRLVEHAAETEKRCGDRPVAVCLFRRHVSRRSQHGAICVSAAHRGRFQCLDRSAPGRNRGSSPVREDSGATRSGLGALTRPRSPSGRGGRKATSCRLDIAMDHPAAYGRQSLRRLPARCATPRRPRGSFAFELPPAIRRKGAHGMNGTGPSGVAACHLKGLHDVFVSRRGRAGFTQKPLAGIGPGGILGRSPSGPPPPKQRVLGRVDQPMPPIPDAEARDSFPAGPVHQAACGAPYRIRPRASGSRCPLCPGCRFWSSRADRASIVVSSRPKVPVPPPRRDVPSRRRLSGQPVFRVQVLRRLLKALGARCCQKFLDIVAGRPRPNFPRKSTRDRIQGAVGRP